MQNLQSKGNLYQIDNIIINANSRKLVEGYQVEKNHHLQWSSSVQSYNKVDNIKQDSETQKDINLQNFVEPDVKDKFNQKLKKMLTKCIDFF